MSKDKVFTIRVPQKVYEKLDEEATKRDLNAADLVRQFIRLGMIAISDDEKSPKLVLMEGDTFKQVLLV